METMTDKKKSETPTHVLAPYYILASSESIESAIKTLTFELDMRVKRGDLNRDVATVTRAFADAKGPGL